MDPFILLICMLFWIIYLLAQALFINGIFISAKGSTSKRADGTDDDSEMIFYPIYKYLHRTYPVKVYFIRKMLDISTAPKNTGLEIKWDDFWKDGLLVRGYKVVGSGSTLPWETWIREFYQGKMQFDQMNHRIAFYLEEDRYVFSKYIRKPVIGCIICMSSFWSIFTYALPVYHFYGWSWHITVLWFFDIVSLAYVNYLIFKNRT